MTQHYYCYAIGAGNPYNDSEYESIAEATEKADEEYADLCAGSAIESEEMLAIKEFYYDEDGERVQVEVHHDMVVYGVKESDYEERGTNR